MSAEANPKWEIKPLGDCLLFMSRGVAPSYVSDSPIAALNQKAIRWGHIEKRHLKFHDPAKKIKQDVLIRQKDVVVNSTGDITIGRAYYFKKPWPNLFADSHVTILRLNSDILLPEFCIYLFPLPEYQGKIYGLVTGATGQLELSKSNLSKLQVVVPPLPTQQKIAAILSAYDDLIENNLRRIEILEEMAQDLYREWFVKLRFPGHQHARFTDSPLGKIPEGWSVGTVENTFSILGGGTPSKSVREYWENGTINWYVPTDLTGTSSMFMNHSGNYINELGLKKSSARLFPAYSVMMTSRATLGVISINTTEACTNQGFITCVPNKRFPLYTLFYWLKEHVEYFISLGTGATFKEITKGVFKTIELIVPAQAIVSEFEDIVQQFAVQVLKLQRKNTILRQTRDLLLPKLISGELDVAHTVTDLNLEV